MTRFGLDETHWTIAPRWKPWLRRADSTWPEPADAAWFLRSDLNVSKSLWIEACFGMGREQAAIAIVSTKDPAHFRTTAGGYFHGMVTKARAGELHLDRTLWGLRGARDPKPPERTGRGRRPALSPYSRN